MTRSQILPTLVGTNVIDLQLLTRFAKLYNGIKTGRNAKMLLLADISVHSSKVGFIGANVKHIRRGWSCCAELLYPHVTYDPSTEVVQRVNAIKELVSVREGMLFIPGFEADEVVTILEWLSCH